MELRNFSVSGIVKEVNQKTVSEDQLIKAPSCSPDTPPESVGKEYWEIVLEVSQDQPWPMQEKEKIARLVFFSQKKEWEKQFSIGDKYLFHCTAKRGYYWPHNWKKLTYE